MLSARIRARKEKNHLRDLKFTFTIPIFDPAVNGWDKANIWLSTSHLLFFLRMAYGPNVYFSRPVAKLPYIVALRLVCLRYFGSPFHMMIRLFPSTLYHSTSSVSSRNLTPLIIYFFKRRRLSRTRNVECQNKGKERENYFIHNNVIKLLKLNL